jgi:hypothetical protein
MDKFILKESQWSWRNLLSTSNSPHWRLIRRTTMIWRLNFAMSLKYFRDQDFRHLLNEQMDSPARQLELHFQEVPFKAASPVDNKLMKAINDQERLSFDSLHSLTISNCRRIFCLGSFPSLKYLKISDCANLDSVGQMNNLSSLWLSGFNDSIFLSFPLENLENLENLILHGFAHSFRENFSRLRNLRTLQLNSSVSMRSPEIILPVLPFPQLKSLDLTDYDSVDLTGLTSLKHFRFHTNYKAAEVHGKEQIYPQLTSFESTHILFKDLDLMRKVRTYNGLSSGICMISFNPRVFSVKYEAPQKQNEFHIHKEMKDLTLYCQDFNTVSMATSFSLNCLSLSANNISHLSPFPSWRKLL